MNLNKKVKADLVLALVGQASKKQAKATIAAATKLQKLFHHAALTMAKDHLPELTHERMVELIRSGSLVSQASSAGSELYVTVPKLDDKYHKTEHLQVGGVRHAMGSKDSDDWRRLLNAVNDHWGGLTMVKMERRSGWLSLQWSPSFPDIPAFPGAKYVYDGVENKNATPFSEKWDALILPLAPQALKLTTLVLKVYKEASEYQDLLTGIFEGIRTIKQLEDQFPEAIKYLPAEFKVVKPSRVAPVELINRARQMLETGIPD